MSENLPLELPKQLFSGKTVVITGASRGVGRATALRFAQGGANVVVNYLKNERDAREVVESCQKQNVRAIAIQGDASKIEDAEKIRQAAIEAFGRVDVLVINAGIWKGAPVDEMSEDLWDEVLDTNLKSAWAMCRAIVPEIKKQPRGAIVLVSSTAGQRGEARFSNYAASKGGQISFTKALAAELAPRIRVNCVAPGWIETAMVRPVFENAEYKEQVLNSIPLRRMATTDDVALSICFLASDWAQHITGEILNINGGSVLCG
jgi:3-oxoacyl-[acyl-carrier protein] reductase